jgi:hypothetical protein
MVCDALGIVSLFCARIVEGGLWRNGVRPAVMKALKRHSRSPAPKPGPLPERRKLSRGRGTSALSSCFYTPEILTSGEHDCHERLIVAFGRWLRKSS